jgi:outer membrane protein TolC
MIGYERAACAAFSGRRRARRLGLAILLGLLALSGLTPAVRAQSRLDPSRVWTLAQLIEVSTEVNPVIRAARNRWYSALHSIKQNYAPADPVFSYFNVDSPKNPFIGATEHSFIVSEQFQFPGKALLQAKTARRSARIARLAYQAAVRDIRAQTESAYYQALLDGELVKVNADNVEALRRVLKVTQVAYAAGQVTQTDFISAEFDLAAAEQLQRQFEVNAQNDKTALNQLLYRRPDEPLKLSGELALKPLKVPVDRLVARATARRQEILQMALAEHNSETALELARLEYAPDYLIGYEFDSFVLPSAAPAPTFLRDHSLLVGINVPLFFWIKQDEDVRRARYDLEAARDDVGSIRSQTEAAVTTLYRNARLAYDTALLYRDSLIALARQDFEVALIAYQSGKIDFATLTQALKRSYDARVAYLQGTNQFLAGVVALEQTVGEPLAQ